MTQELGLYIHLNDTGGSEQLNDAGGFVHLDDIYRRLGLHD